MFLYELALELDRKSVDLVEIGTGLGMTGLGPSCTLTPEQEAQLRAAAGGGAAGPGAGPGATGAASPGPAIWGAPPAGGAPIAHHDEAIAPPEPPPSKRGLVAVGAVVIVAIVALGFVALGRDGGTEPLPDGDPALLANVDVDEDPGAASDATSKAPSPAVLDSEDVAAGLPELDALDPLIADRTGYWFDETEDITTTAAAADADARDLGGDCTPEHPAEAKTLHSYDLYDGDGGAHGGVSVSIRTFATADDAQAWLAAHRSAAYQTCQRANLRDDVERTSGAVTSDSYVLEEGVRGGPQDHFSADYTTPSGQLCTAYRDVYFNVVGSVGISTKFDVCYQPFSPAAMDQVVEAMLAAVPAPAPPQG